jgi:membrane-bound lytic murein transglycosylase B
VFVGLAVAGCAAVVGGPANAAPRPAVHPAAAAAPGQALAEPAAQAGAGQLVLSAADLAALRAAGVQPPAAARDAGVGFQDVSPASALAASGIPTTALQAYKNAAAREARRNKACGLSWPLLAGIGRVESNHGRFAGAVLHSDGLSTPRVIGIPLNGNGTALIRDTDGGRLDGDTVYDRAVGPMQFIPSTWAGWGVDANNDSVKDPFNIFDAAAAAADYLCAAGRDLTTTRGQVRAILSYNYSLDYVTLVMSLERVYASGAVGITVPVLPTTPDPMHGVQVLHPTLPPVDPGTPRGVTNPPPKPKPTSTPPSSPPPSSTSPAPKPTASSTSPAPGGSSSSATESTTPPASSSSADPSSPPSDPSTSASSSADSSAPPSDVSSAAPSTSDAPSSAEATSPGP